MKTRYRKIARRYVAWAVTTAARVLRRMLPLTTRQRIVALLGGRQWPGQSIFSIEILRDFAEQDPSDFHRFLWANHLGYSESYEVARRFGASNLQASRHLFFGELAAYMRSRGIDPDKDVHSVFDVGCSLGYVLRFAETDVFRSATILRGLDIDAYAVETGSEYLRRLGSKVELVAADMADLDRVMGDQVYDVVFCCGVLMYLEERLAAQVVGMMLRHARLVVSLMGLAHPETDNQNVVRSDVRHGDEARIHNLDLMVQLGGGRVAHRRWDGARLVDGNSIYIVMGEPGRAGSLESKQLVSARSGNIS
jgi:SAM-dependent methyltransferase